MNAEKLHTAVVTALYARDDFLASATPLPWRVRADDAARADIVSDDSTVVAHGVRPADARLITELRNLAAAVSRGLHTLVERHAPLPYHADRPPCCGWCGVTVAWPCVDYRDALQAVPNLPEEVARVLHR